MLGPRSAVMVAAWLQLVSASNIAKCQKICTYVSILQGHRSVSLSVQVEAQLWHTAARQAAALTNWNCAAVLPW